MRIYGYIKQIVELWMKKDGQDVKFTPNSNTYVGTTAFVVPPKTSGTGTLVGESETQTLTNKTIDGDDNTVQDLALTSLKTVLGDANKVIRRDASGIVVSDNALPNSSAILTTDATQTVTGKTIDADSNTITNIENADIKAGAAIDATKIADGSVTNTEFQYIGTLTSDAQTQLTGKASTALSNLTSVAINTTLVSDTNNTDDLGTAAIGWKEGFINKVSMDSNGQTTSLQGSSSASASVTYSLPPADGGNGQFLQTDGAAALTWATPAGSTDSSYDIKNLTLATSVGSSALTIALKNKAGNDPSGGDAVSIAFRNATSATGTYNVRSVTSALSVTVSSGSTLGTNNNAQAYLYVYALDNSGTVELAVSQKLFDDGSIQSTTAEGGAGAADSSTVLYSTTARSNVPIRLIGRLSSTQTTAGTWASNMSEITLTNRLFPIQPKWQVKTLSSNISTTQTLSDLTFALTAGKTYRIMFAGFIQVNNNTRTSAITIQDGSNYLCELQGGGVESVNGVDTAFPVTYTGIYTMAGTSLTVVFTPGGGSGANLLGNGTRQRCHMIVEELPNHVSGTVT